MNKIEIKQKHFTAASKRSFQVTCFTINGTAPGPVMTIIAGQHGMEHSGPNFLPEFIEEMTKRDFSGTLNVCPCANPVALEMDYEFYPENEDLTKIKDYYYSIFRHNYCPWGLGRDDGNTFYNMNRLWNRQDAPGVAGEVTRWLWNAVCRDANIIIDLHGLNAEKPLIYNYSAKNDPIICFSGFEAVFLRDTKNFDAYDAGNLCYQGSLGKNRYAICLEFSRQHGLKESEYPLGIRALNNIMTGCGMLEGKVTVPKKLWGVTFDPPRDAECVLYASHTGHIRYFRELYEPVKKGDKIFEVRDFETIKILEEGFALNDGIVCDISPFPVAKPGSSCCWIAPATLLVDAGTELEKLPRNFFLNNETK